MTPQNVTAVLGETVTISCHYPCKFYSQEKYWCKWSNEGCRVLPSQDESARQSSMSCDQSSQLISMTLNPVSKEDEGWYWCGVKQGQTYGETIAIYVAVEEKTGGESQGQSVPASIASHGRAYERPLLRTFSIWVILRFSYRRRVEEQIVVVFLFNLSIQTSLIGASQTRLRFPLHPAILHSDLKVRLLSVHFLLLHLPKTDHKGWPGIAASE